MVSLFSLTKKLVAPDVPTQEELERAGLVQEPVVDEKAKRLETIRNAMKNLPLENTLEETAKAPEIIPQPKESKLEPEIVIKEGEKLIEIPQASEPAPETIEITVKEEPKNEASAETHEEKIVRSASGFELVNIFLSEVHDLLDAGKVLEELNKKRESTSLATEQERAQSKALEESSQKIRESINALILAQDSDEDVTEKLKKASSAMEEYDTAFSVELAKIESTRKVADDELILEITQKKAEIKKILGIIGGTENFEKIKKVIRFAEKKVGSEVINSAISEFLNNIKQVVGKDLPGTKLLVNSNDIVAICMRLAQGQK